MIKDIIFDLSNKQNMNNYTAQFTQRTPFKRINITIQAPDYLVALTTAREIAADKGYRFDDLTFAGKVKKTKTN